MATLPEGAISLPAAFVFEGDKVHHEGRFRVIRRCERADGTVTLVMSGRRSLSIPQTERLVVRLQEDT